MLLSRTRQVLLPLASSSALLSFAPTRNMSSSSSPFPAYLLHAPFLAVQPPNPADGSSAPGQLLQRTLPPAPLYYTHPAPKNPPGTAPPVVSLTPTDPIQGRISTVYRATAPTGEKLVLKYGTDLLALMREAEEVYVNLPAGGLPIPTFWGIFEGKVLEEQTKSLVMVMEDCGEPVQGGFEALTRAERFVLRLLSLPSAPLESTDPTQPADKSSLTPSTPSTRSTSSTAPSPPPPSSLDPPPRLLKPSRPYPPRRKRPLGNSRLSGSRRPSGICVLGWTAAMSWSRRGGC